MHSFAEVPSGIKASKAVSKFLERLSTRGRSEVDNGCEGEVDGGDDADKSILGSLLMFHATDADRNLLAFYAVLAWRLGNPVREMFIPQTIVELPGGQLQSLPHVVPGVTLPRAGR